MLSTRSVSRRNRVRAAPNTTRSAPRTLSVSAPTKSELLMISAARWTGQNSVEALVIFAEGRHLAPGCVIREHVNKSNRRVVRPADPCRKVNLDRVEGAAGAKHGNVVEVGEISVAQQHEVAERSVCEPLHVVSEVTILSTPTEFGQNQVHVARSDVCIKGLTAMPASDVNDRHRMTQRLRCGGEPIIESQLDLRRCRAGPLPQALPDRDGPPRRRRREQQWRSRSGRGLTSCCLKCRRASG